MPGSLLRTDAYSDVSDVSGRSLNGKKVSFNRAVKVKQYPWKADSNAELLTLPSDRFWFRVYRNKEPISYETWSGEEKSDEYTEDCLPPISEADDLSMDGSNLQMRRNGSRNNLTEYHMNDIDSNYEDQPNNPNSDYFNKKSSGVNRDFNKYKSFRDSDKTDHHNGFRSTNSNIWRGDEYRSDKLKSIDENSTYSSSMSNNRLLPRIDLKNDSPNRRSLRRVSTSKNGVTRERRARSHDDFMDNDSRSVHIRRADKSVSTEDLNYSNGRAGFVSKLHNNSKDAATQYYDILTRNKTQSNDSPPISLKTNLYDSLSERLKKFETPKSRLNPSRESNNYVKIFEKDYSLEKLSNVIPKRLNDFKRKNDSPTQIGRSQKQYPVDTFERSYTFNRSSKPFTPTENRDLNFIQKPVDKDIQPYTSRFDVRTNRNNSNQNYNDRKLNGVGYLGRDQTPLREVNGNTQYNFLSRNGISNKQNSSHESHTKPLNSHNYEKTKYETTNKYQPKSYVSPYDQEKINFKNSLYSPKNDLTSREEPVIDWTHSGFKLAPKPKFSSASDSEYTVNKRPPLLMYIPGISHHDRPAEEDDRLSHLSDFSRSERNNGSQMSGFSSRNRSNIDDFHLRRSMREGKSKWMKWRKKS